MRKRILLAALLGLGLAGAPDAHAEGAETAASTEASTASGSAGLTEQERDRRAEAIARGIMSPFCPGRTVSACPNAGPWREDIRTWVGEGVSAEDIRERLAARVPKHNLRGAPMKRYSWLIPTILTLLGMGLLVFLMRYLVTPRKSDPLDGTGAVANGDAAAAEAGAGDAKRSNEDWDARLEQELDSLES